MRLLSPFRVFYVLFVFFVLCFAAAMSVRADESLLSPIPFNAAEAIIEPFWDPAISGFPKWEVEDGSGHGLHVFQNWAAVDYQWEKEPLAGPALRMRRIFNVDCAGYDRLLLTMVAPEGARVRITVETDAGVRTHASTPLPSHTIEHAVDLEGATRIGTIVIEIEAAGDVAAAGWFRWIGLQNTALLPAYFAQWDLSGIRWETHLVPEDYEPKFEPRYGIFLESDELEALRAEHEQSVRETGTSSYLQQAEAWRSIVPERGIHEFVDSGGRENESDGRVWNAQLARLEGSPKVARAGLVLKDKALLRLAARYALSRVVSDKWDDGFMGRFPGSSWEFRSFRRGYCCQDVAEILDLAGEMFTDTGRIYVMRRLAEEGIGPANYITWRFDYLYHSNQMTFFGYGRMWAYLVLEREWPRVKPYTDIAAQDLLDLFQNVIMEDGGFDEPPTYFGGTIRRGCEMLERYARARGRDPVSILPANLRRTGDYAAVIASTIPEDDVIPLGDSGTRLGNDSLLTLSALIPESYWVTMLRKSLARNPRARWDFQDEKKLKTLPEYGPPAPALVVLPDTGLMASTRRFGDHTVKLFLMGNKGNITHDHEHEDKGSFVLEFAGEAFACDPGILEYNDPVHNLLKQSQRHNMLAPVGTPERAHPAPRIFTDVKPAGAGDETAFHAEIDATPGWDGYYATWVRGWDSPTPNRLTIRDRYELETGDGVEFYWQTMLPCDVDGDTALISGTHGRVALRASEGCALRIDRLPYSGGVTQSRIVFAKPGRAGELEVAVELIPAG